jgi:hypothetical protein
MCRATVVVLNVLFASLCLSGCERASSPEQQNWGEVLERREFSEATVLEFDLKSGNHCILATARPPRTGIAMICSR